MKRLLPLALCLPLVLASCGLEGDDENAPAPRRPADRPAPQQPAGPQGGPLRPSAGLPQPTAGVVEINGEETGSLTPSAVDGYRGNVRESHDGASEALAQLCRGEIDIADSARPISFREFQACNQNGLELTTFQVASDAVVVAIRNETDIGADCLTMTQVQRIFETGSTIENWRDVSPDYFDVPLETTGPNEDANAFDYFAQRVLDIPDDATLEDFRTDYTPHPTDEGTRSQVVGERRSDLDRFILELDDRRQALDARIARFFEIIVPLDDRIRRLDRRIRELDTIIGFGVDPDERGLKRTRDRLARRRAVLARRRAAADRRRRAADRQQQDLVNRLIPLVREARRRQIVTRGVLGLFRFSFYEQYEQQLRPFEIEDNKGDAETNDRCVFPSQATITQGVYPLARRLLLFTTQRSLERAEVRAFIRSYLERARELAIQERLVPLPEPQVLREISELEESGAAPREPTPRPGDTTPGDTTPDEQLDGANRPDLPNSGDGPSYLDEGTER